MAAEDPPRAPFQRSSVYGEKGHEVIREGGRLPHLSTSTTTPYSTRTARPSSPPKAEGNLDPNVEDSLVAKIKESKKQHTFAAPRHSSRRSTGGAGGGGGGIGQRVGGAVFKTSTSAYRNNTTITPTALPLSGTRQEKKRNKGEEKEDTEEHHLVEEKGGGEGISPRCHTSGEVSGSGGRRDTAHFASTITSGECRSGKDQGEGGGGYRLSFNQFSPLGTIPPPHTSYGGGGSPRSSPRQVPYVLRAGTHRTPRSKGGGRSGGGSPRTRLGMRSRDGRSGSSDSFVSCLRRSSSSSGGGGGGNGGGLASSTTSTPEWISPNLRRQFFFSGQHKHGAEAHPAASAGAVVAPSWSSSSPLSSGGPYIHGPAPAPAPVHEEKTDPTMVGESREEVARGGVRSGGESGAHNEEEEEEDRRRGRAGSRTVPSSSRASVVSPGSPSPFASSSPPTRVGGVIVGNEEEKSEKNSSKLVAVGELHDGNEHEGKKKEKRWNENGGGGGNLSSSSSSTQDVRSAGEVEQEKQGEERERRREEIGEEDKELGNDATPSTARPYSILPPGRPLPSEMLVALPKGTNGGSATEQGVTERVGETERGGETLLDSSKIHPPPPPPPPPLSSSPLPLPLLPPSSSFDVPIEVQIHKFFQQDAVTPYTHRAKAMMEHHNLGWVKQRGGGGGGGGTPGLDSLPGTLSTNPSGSFSRVSRRLLASRPQKKAFQGLGELASISCRGGRRACCLGKKTGGNGGCSSSSSLYVSSSDHYRYRKIEDLALFLRSGGVVVSPETRYFLDAMERREPEEMTFVPIQQKVISGWDDPRDGRIWGDDAEGRKNKMQARLRSTIPRRAQLSKLKYEHTTGMVKPYALGKTTTVSSSTFFTEFSMESTMERFVTTMQCQRPSKGLRGPLNE